ncbi:MAG: hypothetical protein ACT6R7_16865 [Brevundimonas aurantiaca]|jgi:type III secretory pathway component EscS|uniref:hypothetical protein n=1 Tax=Brevundimonas aurantiaca TaxID=74316 RepID=UPI0040336C18
MRQISPIIPTSIAASVIGLLASLLIGLTPVVHRGLPLALYAAGLMITLIGVGIIIDRRQRLPVPVIAQD